MAFLQARFAVGVIGNIATLSTSLAPIPTFWRICRKKSTEEFSVLPYAMSFVCNLLWGWYALPFITDDNLLLLIICAAQVFLQSLYLAIYFVFAGFKQKVRLMIILASILMLCTGVVLLTTLVLHHKGHKRKFAGSFATAASLATFAAPLSIMGLVVRTKSVEFMPLLLSLSLFFNCFTWTVYGILGSDIFLTIADGFGAILAIVQLVLYSVYRKAKPHVHVEEALPAPAAAGQVKLTIIVT